MASTILHFATIKFDLNAGIDSCDITDKLNSIISRSEIENGFANACIIGSTSSLITIKNQPEVVKELKDAIDRVAPKNTADTHELSAHSGNGYSHVQAALLGPSVELPIRKGQLKLGRWQQVVAINFDHRSMKLLIEVTLIGEIISSLLSGARGPFAG